MKYIIGLPTERQSVEQRVALVPASVSKLVKAGFQVRVQSGCGNASLFSDIEYKNAGAKIEKTTAFLSKVDIIVKVKPPQLKPSREVESYKKSAFVFCIQDIQKNKVNLPVYQAQTISAFALERIPRSSLAQSMDVLSSMATCAGYRAVLEASYHYPHFFPMLMTASGTIKPAKVLVLGAGVAGLQAIATAKRLGAMVSAFDLRPIVKEQILSLGAKFITVLEDEEAKQDQQGYAKEASKDFIKREMAIIEEHLSQSDICITTAQIFGKKAPILITKDMVDKMRPGSVIVDLAIEQGGNCAVSKKGKTIKHNGVTIIAHDNMVSKIASDASLMFSKNVENLLLYIFDPKKPIVDLNQDDEIINRTLLTHKGQLIKENL